MNEATRETRERIQNSIIGKHTLFVYIYIYILTLFLQGAKPPINPLAYSIKGHVHTAFFYNPFLNLSLISRFPIYAHFGAKLGRRIAGEIEAPGSRDCPVIQGTPSPVSPLAYGNKVCVRAYGTYAFQF